MDLENIKGRGRGGRGRGIKKVEPPTPNPPSTTISSTQISELDIRELAEKFENDFGPSTSHNTGTSSGNGATNAAIFITKPVEVDKKGKNGKRFNIISNYIRMNFEETYVLRQFRVDFNPPEDDTRKKKEILRRLAEDKTAVIKVGQYVFDGHTLYKTDLFLEEASTCQVVLNSGETYDVQFRLTSIIGHDDQMFVQFHNNVIRKCLTLMNYEELGRHFYDRKSEIALVEDGITLWPGLITAIRQHEKDTLLCLEVTHKVLRTESVLDVMKKLSRGNLTDSNEQNKVEAELLGTIVLTHYNRKTYKIDKIDFNTTPRSSFDLGDGESTTYADYYKNRYKIELEDDELNQPMIVSYPRKRDVNKGVRGDIYLVPSICYMTGLSDEMRRNFQLMKRLSEHLHMGPADRMKRLNAFLKSLKENEKVKEEFRSWHLNFHDKFVTAEAREFNKEKITLCSGNGNLISVDSDANYDWSRQFKNNHLLEISHVKNWIIFSPRNSLKDAENLSRIMKTMASQLGVEINAPLEIIPYDERGRIEDMANRTIDHHMSKNKIDLVFIILYTNAVVKYSDFKKVCILKGLPSQCFLRKNLNHKNLQSVASKVVIQVCAKLGGQPWTIDMPFKKMMVAGFDVYHTSVDRKGTSVGALVSTKSENLANYFSVVNFHKSPEELAANLSKDIKKCVKAYHKENGHLPARIVLFRDGVGDGQIKFVVENEIEQIKKGLIDMYDKENEEFPKFTVIIVTKKINSRMVMQLSNGTYKNPPPGSVLDDVITLPERYDFFLVSQCVRQGTVSPTNYNVVYDVPHTPPDRLQKLAYKMCHLYFNWSGTVAVPAPCQYAHKLAYLTSLTIKNNEETPKELNGKLWYL